MVLKAKVHSAKVPDQDGLRVLLESAQARFSRLKHLWVDAGYQGRGKRWAEAVLGLSVEVVRKPPKPVPKKVEVRKRHLLVDTEGLVLEAKVHSAKVPDQDGLRLLLESAQARLSRLKHLWVDAGYQGRGRRWAEEVLGLSVEVVRKPPKPVPEKVAMVWAQEWAKEGEEVDWQRLMPPRGFRVLPRRRWVVERTFSWIDQNRRMSKDYERLAATSEAFVYVAMSRLMVRRLARTQ